MVRRRDFCPLEPDALESKFAGVMTVIFKSARELGRCNSASTVFEESIL